MTVQTFPMQGDDLIDVQQIGGDLAIEGWERPELEARGGDARIERRGSVVAVSCGGEVTLKLPRGARLSVSGVGGDVNLENLSGSIELTHVGGNATLKNLSGAVHLSGLIGGETRLQNVPNILMTSGKPGDRLDLAERIRRKVEHTTRRAESRIRQASQRSAQRWAMSGDRMEQAGHSPWDQGEAPSPSDGTEAVDEERLKILKMLQDKKINSQQAEQLLAALEGNG